MRLAVIDLLFSWPPHGGADVDVYHVLHELQKAGGDVCLFYASDANGWERGRVDGPELPFPSVRVDFSEQKMTPKTVSELFLKEMRHFAPDRILLTQGYFLKTGLILTLAEFPLVSRCYAHEVSCHKDIVRFRDGAPCPNAYAQTPDACRRCALKHLSRDVKAHRHTAWTWEYLAARAWTLQYYRDFIRAMKTLKSVIITTEHMRDEVEQLCLDVHVIPHGVDVERFVPVERPEEKEKPVIVVPGRLEDPVKGIAVALEAGDILAQRGISFEMRVTLPEGYAAPPWLTACGKIPFDQMPHYYQQADICIVPSIWEEPFGIVALEAMATGLPVCASRIGGG